MRYIWIFLLGLIIGAIGGFFLSVKIAFNYSLDNVYSNIESLVSNIYTGNSLDIQKQKELIINKLKYKKEEIKNNIKQQIKKEIEKQIDEIFNF